MSLPAQRQDAYRAANEASARLILADPARYGGEGAALVVWARKVLEGSNEGDKRQ